MGQIISTPRPASDTVAGVVEIATSAETRAGADVGRVISPLALKDALGFSAFYSSGSQVITQAGALTLAHGLGRMPVLVQLFLACNVAEHGYSAGDMVFIDPGQQDGAYPAGTSIVPDAVNLNIRYASNANVYIFTHKNTGAVVVPTLTSWSTHFCAWA